MYSSGHIKVEYIKKNLILWFSKLARFRNGKEGGRVGDICEYLSGLSIKSPYYLCVNVNSLISVKIFGGVMKPLV